MKKLSIVLFIVVFLSREAFAEEVEMGGMDIILFDQTYQISKSACLARDPKNARISDEIWRQWEDENNEELIAIRDIRMAIETKLEKIGAGKNGNNPSEMERQAYTIWLRTRDLILARMQESWDKRTDDEVEKLCEDIRLALPQPPIQKAGQDALVRAHRILEDLQQEFP